MKYILLLIFLIGAASCNSTPKKYSAEQVSAESKKLNEFFETKFKEGLAKNPMFLTYVGSKDRYDELNDLTPEFEAEQIETAKTTLNELKKNFEYDALNKNTKLSYRLFEQELKQTIEGEKFKNNGYMINQMYGIHSQLPSFMMNMHKVDNVSDAEAYVKRLWAFNRVLTEAINAVKRQKSPNYPEFIFPKVISDSKNILKGRPFDKKAKFDSTILKDFSSKIKPLKISKAKKNILLQKANNALLSSVQPGYEKIVALMTDLSKQDSTPKGIWSQPNGKEFYKFRLKNITTTDYSPEKIHKTGLSEITRIHNEMKAIAKKVGFKEDLPAFFNYVKNKKELFYSDTKSGRAAYLKDANEIISGMKARLDDLFITKPKADLIVKAVEPYREKSAGIAFYQSPSLTGSRPGIYYVNLSDMKSVAKYDMEALAYHEALPGHHMQLTIAQEIKNIPTFRKLGGYTAYSEGWGLYSELIPKEIGFYKDPYSDFGRLSMELWRAARLVVDTGIHHYKWSYDKAIAYLKDNTPNSEDEITKGIQRYFVMPGQATAYKIGQLKILELRALAKKTLKDEFNIQKFHEVVLKNGALPLYELEEQVSNYSKTGTL